MVEEVFIIVMNQSEDDIQPKIVRGRVDSLSLYEVTDYELQILEQGSVGATYLNFAIFAISIASSFLVSLLTATIDSTKVFVVFINIVIIGYSFGVLLLVLWMKTRKSQSKVIERIKERCHIPKVPHEAVSRADVSKEESSE